MATEIDSAYVTIYPVTSGFAGAIGKAMNEAGAKGGGSFGNAIMPGVSRGSIAAGNIMASAFTKAAQIAGDSLGAAISRVDTMNNFPKTMKNLGYSAEEASASIEKMSDRLQGLPTSLDGMTSMVQQLAPITGSLDEATEVGLAFNDMLLASGKNMNDQSRAMMQYTQMLGKGTVDMQSWRTLQEVMPGQLNQMAEALLGAGHSAGDLYNAMQDGTVTFDDFNNAMLKLDKEGLGEYASFAEQAKDATGGINTAITNFKTMVVRSLANIIEAIGASNISGIINDFSSIIGGLIGTLTPFFELIGSIVGKIAEGIAWLAEKMKPISSALKEFNAEVSKAYKAVLKKFVEWLKKAWQGVKDFWDGLKRFFKGIVDEFRSVRDALVGAFNAIKNGVMGLWNGIKSVWDSIMNFFSNLKSNIVNFFSNAGSWLVEAGKKIIKGLWNGVKEAWNNFVDMFNDLFSGFNSKNGNITITYAGGVSYSGNVYDNAGKPRTARGGIVTRATSVLAGEGGPEAIIPLSNPHLKPFVGDGGKTVNVYINGAKVNSDEHIENSFYSFMSELSRLAVMQGV